MLKQVLLIGAAAISFPALAQEAPPSPGTTPPTEQPEAAPMPDSAPAPTDTTAPPAPTDTSQRGACADRAGPVEQRSRDPRANRPDRRNRISDL